MIDGSNLSPFLLQIVINEFIFRLLLFTLHCMYTQYIGVMSTYHHGLLTSIVQQKVVLNATVQCWKTKQSQKCILPLPTPASSTALQNTFIFRGIALCTYIESLTSAVLSYVYCTKRTLGLWSPYLTWSHKLTSNL